MTAKEKASNLFEYYKSQINESDFHIPEFISGVGMDSDEYGEVLVYHTNSLAKQCALIAVDEILGNDKESFKVAEELHPHAQGLIYGSIIYWKEVKKEIENL